MEILPSVTPPDSGDACCAPAPQSCCGPETHGAPKRKAPWILGDLPAGSGTAPRVSTTLNLSDRLGAWKVRWGIGRNTYSIPPGLYGVGTPDGDSPVLVTANYKLTFDSLRKELEGLNAWIVVLDTKGVNVWCAAGKGTFGTEELVRRVRAVRLSEVVTHRTLILPQLGAPGVSAHFAAKRTGFTLRYGPVRASDLKAYLAAGMTATEEMRRVRFSTWDRLELTPVELMPALKAAIFAFGILFLLNALGFTGFDGLDLAAVLGAVFAGAVVTPVLLPVLPGRMFSVKGLLLGLAWAAAVLFSASAGPLRSAAYLTLLPAIASYLALNFTGASTYTSFSGVKKEMTRMMIPILASGLLGTILLLADAALRG